MIGRTLRASSQRSFELSLFEQSRASCDLVFKDSSCVIEQVVETRIGDRIQHIRAISSRGHDPLPAQHSQVLRDVGTGHLDTFLQFTDRAFAGTQLFEQPDAHFMAERPEKLSLELLQCWNDALSSYEARIIVSRTCEYLKSRPAHERSNGRSCKP